MEEGRAGVGSYPEIIGSNLVLYCGSHNSNSNLALEPVYKHFSSGILRLIAGIPFAYGANRLGARHCL